jgi:hypothetical protein
MDGRGLFPQCPSGQAQSNSDAAKSILQETAAPRERQRDFDPFIGSWKYHLKRHLNPLTSSNTWVELDGTGVCYKIWDGRAKLDTIEVDGPTDHIEGLTLRMYTPQSRQWSLNFANSTDSTLRTPTVGEFENGRGEFYDQELFNGKIVFVRFVISDITPNSCHFKQAFSDDGGKT